ncbi:MAG: hypothetical protein JSR44_06980 [Spirochaetes bacterium]|nr:hypothetical protein [Spirochaetota bacterium]
MPRITTQLIAISANEIKSLLAELRAYRLFFSLAAIIFSSTTFFFAWYFVSAASIRATLSAIAIAACIFCVIFYGRQRRRIRTILSDGYSLLYAGIVTHKEELNTESERQWRLWIDNRAFDVAEFVYGDVTIGDFLSVREWNATHEYIEHSLDPNYVYIVTAREAQSPPEMS